jgi:hypothetical protein
MLNRATDKHKNLLRSLSGWLSGLLQAVVAKGRLQIKKGALKSEKIVLKMSGEESKKRDKFGAIKFIGQQICHKLIFISFHEFDDSVQGVHSFIGVSI